MNENSVCPIWGTAASVRGISNSREKEVVDSPRAGGQYVISHRAENLLKYKDESFKARLTSWLIEQRRLGEEYPEVTIQTIEEIEQSRDLSVHERADKLLQYIRQATSAIGEQVTFIEKNLDKINAGTNRLQDLSDGYLTRYRMMAWSECTKSFVFDETEFLLEYLDKKNLIERGPHIHICRLTVDGYARLAELEKVAPDSSQAFVAMWFDDSMKDTYENGIKPGIEDVGYKAFRIDKEEYLDKIDDKIIAEIKRSRFLVADFTHKDIETCQGEQERKKAGARGSVYYEAGFADGLNIPVIFTCRADLLEKVHFDTRQYPHISWEPEKLKEFREALANRIAKTIGDGPNKTQNAE